VPVSFFAASRNESLRCAGLGRSAVARCSGSRVLAAADGFVHTTVCVYHSGRV
jgi:hypothetical protein